jgi:dihydrofolate reductase
MSNVVAFTTLSLDGVMQAPGREDEDTRGGFEHGGWAMPYGDEVLGEATQESMSTTGALIMGHRTYKDVLSFWNMTDSPFKEVLNNTQKYVASKSADTSLDWPNSELLKGDAADAVAGLRKKAGKDYVVLGSGDLMQSLLQADLIDKLILLIHPLVLGSGRRLFGKGAQFQKFRLVESKPTSTGVIIAIYEAERA